MRNSLDLIESVIRFFTSIIITSNVSGVNKEFDIIKNQFFVIKNPPRKVLREFCFIQHLQLAKRILQTLAFDHLQKLISQSWHCHSHGSQDQHL